MDSFEDKHCCGGGFRKTGLQSSSSVNNKKKRSYKRYIKINIYHAELTINPIFSGINLSLI